MAAGSRMTAGCRMGDSRWRQGFLALLFLVGCAHGELRVARVAGLAAVPLPARVRVIRRQQDLPPGREVAWFELTGDEGDLELTEMVTTLREAARAVGADVVAMVRVDRVVGAVRVVAVAIRR